MTRERDRGVRPEDYSIDADKLLNELKVHRTVLELRNEELRRVRDDLKESRDRFAALFNRAPVGYVVLDRACVIQEANETFCKLVRQSIDRVRGHSFLAFLGEAHRVSFQTDYDRLFAKPMGRRLEAELLSDGRPLWAQLDASPGEELNSQASDTQPALFLTVSDVSDRKRAEEALREALVKQEAAVGAGNVGLWDWDLATGKVYYSSEWKRQIGYEENEIGNDFSEWENRVHPDDSAQALETLRLLLESSSNQYESEFRFKHKNGSYRYILARGTVMRDEAGRPFRVLGSHMDITERRRAERDLSRRVEFERLVSEISSEFVGLGVDDLDVAIERALASIGAFTGADRAYVFLMHKDGTLADNTHEWCAEGVEPEKENLKSIPLDEELPWFAERIRRHEVFYQPDVSAMPHEARLEREHFEAQGIRSLVAVPMTSGEQLVGFLGFDAVRKPRVWTNQDLSLLRLVGETFTNALERRWADEALHESEERYRAIAEDAPIMICRFLHDCEITYVNEAYCSYFGKTSMELVGSSFLLLIPGEERERVMASLTALTPESPTRTTEHSVIAPGSEVRRQRRTDRALFDERGNIVAFQSVGEDVTERRRVEAEREITLNLLRLLAQPNGMQSLMRDVTSLLRSWSGCEAVGIRLLEGEDYPYYLTSGFPAEFVRAESRLCALDSHGEPIRDAQGNPVLECMCGNVIRGRFDAGLPFFTENGSFWTNSTTELLASTTEEDRQARTRNRCHGEGYESVALIPLRHGSRSLGLLQINDSRRNRFDEAKIGLFERLASNLSIGLVQRQTAEILREREETYRALVSGLPDIVMRFDRDGRRLFVSENIDDWYAFKAEGLVGKTHGEAGLPEEDRRFWEESVRKVFDRATPFEAECTVETKRGPTVFNRRLIPETDAQGTVRSVLAVSRDITEERRLKQDYEILFREMLNGFALHEIICDKSGTPVDYRFLAVNPAFERMTGLTADQAVGGTVLEIFPEIEPYWIETYGRVALTGKPAFFESYTQELGKHFEVMAFRPMPGRFACIFTDITDRKLAEEERENLRAQLNQAQKMESVGRLAGGVAHDFNNMLGVILGHTELALEQTEPGEALFADLEEIQKAAQRSADLTRQLLAFARKQTISPKVLDLNGTVEGILKMLRRLMGENIDLAWLPGKNLWSVKLIFDSSKKLMQ